MKSNGDSKTKDFFTVNRRKTAWMPVEIQNFFNLNSAVIIKDNTSVSNIAASSLVVKLSYESEESQEEVKEERMALKRISRCFTKEENKAIVLFFLAILQELLVLKSYFITN